VQRVERVRRRAREGQAALGGAPADVVEDLRALAGDVHRRRLAVALEDGAEGDRGDDHLASGVLLDGVYGVQCQPGVGADQVEVQGDGRHGSSGRNQ
jgi:hypothetical protein